MVTDRRRHILSDVMSRRDVYSLKRPWWNYVTYASLNYTLLGYRPEQSGNDVTMW